MLTELPAKKPGSGGLWTDHREPALQFGIPSVDSLGKPFLLVEYLDKVDPLQLGHSNSIARGLLD